MVSKAQKQALRQRLETDRDRLRVELADLSSQLPAWDGSPNDSHYGNHVADEGTDIFEDEKTIALHAHLSGMLAEVDAALERMEASTYGRCENCSQEIAFDRLEVLPWTRFCIRCQGQFERKRIA